VTATVRACDQPVNLDVVGGDVWVPCDGSNEVARIDVATAKVVERIPAGMNTAVVAGAEGDVWVSNFDADSVWRIRPG
jgi:DNA-binding beta-propeller fold protein YncE